MPAALINLESVPRGLPPGTYCCRLDESSTWGDFRARMIVPPRLHEPGDCLIQLVKHSDDDEMAAVQAGKGGQ